MKKFKLIADEIPKFLETCSVQISNDEYIEYLEGNFVYNFQGMTSFVESVTFEYPAIMIENSPKTWMQGLICDYFNLGKTDVICLTSGAGEGTFYIKTLDTRIYVGHRNSVSFNETYENGERITDYNGDTIGRYRRLGRSECYFRWLERDEF